MKIDSFNVFYRAWFKNILHLVKFAYFDIFPEKSIKETNELLKKSQIIL